MPPMIHRLTRLLKIGAVIGAALGLIRALRGRRSPEVTGKASWPPLAETAAPAPRTGPVRFETAPTEDSAADTANGADSAEGADSWLPPVDGECPEGHRIKVNARSGIYHVPGGASYDRTTPERCYPTAEEAEADGFRPAKR